MDKLNTMVNSSAPEVEIKLETLLRSRGVVLETKGRSLMGKCPFHGGEGRSLIVHSGRDAFECRACGRSGGAVDFLAAFDGISRTHACELLRDGVAAFSNAPRSRRRRSTVRRLDRPLDEAASDPALLEQAAVYCHERLMNNGAVLQRLEELRIGDEDALRKFRIGFADRSLGLRIPDKNRRTGGILRKRLKQLGLLRQSGHEHFGGALMLPVPASDSGVCGIYGRRIGRKLRNGVDPDLWLPPLSPPIWNRESLAGRELVVCLRPLDALTLWINGLRNCTFIYGDAGDAAHLLDTMQTARVETVRLCFPNTTSGAVAAERCAVAVFGNGFEVFQARFPLGMGAYEYTADFENPKAALRDLMAAAEWKGDSAARISVSRLPEKQGEVCAARSGDFLFIEMTDREYRMTESGRGNEAGRMKITLRLRRGRRFHIDRIDLYIDRDRRRFAARASKVTGFDNKLLANDLGTLLLILEKRRHVLSKQEIQTEPGPVLLEQTRRILDAARTIVSGRKTAGKDGFFTRRELRLHLGCGATQTRRHIERLRDLGLVSLIQCRPGRAFLYELNENGGEK